MSSISAGADTGAARGDDINVAEHLLSLWRRKWLVVGTWVLCIVAAILYSVIVPKVYEATVQMLQPKEQAPVSTASTLLAAASGVIGVPIGSSSPNRDILVFILKSDTIARKVVLRFGLKERFQVDYVEDAIKQFLEDWSRVDATLEGGITVTVGAWEPQLAADMVNYWVQEADKLFTEFQMSQAGGQRVFIGKQLDRTRQDLAKAEEELRRFQEKNRAIVLPDQTRMAIEGAARIKGEIMASEVQLQVMRAFAAETNPDVVSLVRRIAEMKKELTAVQYGDNTRIANSRPDFHVPFSNVPEVGLELARLTREVKVQEAVLAGLTQQHEQSKIAEVQNLPSVQIVSRGLPPPKAARPKLVFNMLIGAGLGLVLGVLVALAFNLAKDLRAAMRAPAQM